MPSSKKRFVAEVENITNVLKEHSNNYSEGDSSKNLFERPPAREDKKDVRCETKCGENPDAEKP